MSEPRLRGRAIRTQRTSVAISCRPSIWPGRLVGTSGTWLSQHTLTHSYRHPLFAVFFFFLCGARSQPDWTLLRPRGLHACRHARTDTHTEVASGVGHNLEKAVVPEEFPWMACLQEQNNCSFIRSFHPASHPSMCPRKRKRWNLDSGAVVSTEQCFLGTLKHVIFAKHGGLEGKGKPGIEFPRII